MLHPHSLYYDHLNARELDFLKKAVAFCAEKIAPHAADWEEKEELPRELGEGSSEIQRLIISRALLKEAEAKYGLGEPERK